jgi:hypothetical protein
LVPHAQDYTEERENGSAKLGPRDVHGIEGLNIQNFEAAGPVHQHLGQALVANDGVDNERVAPRSGNTGRVAATIEGDWSARPTEELGDGALGGTNLLELDLVLTLGVAILRTSEDHETTVQLREVVPFLCRCSLIFGRLLVAVPTLALDRLT